MANTYTLIASSTVGAGGASSFDFTSIPSTYTDLLIKISARDTFADVANSFSISFNGGGTATTSRFLYGTGTSAASSSGNTFGGYLDSANATSSTFGNYEIYIPNYASSNNKSFSIDSVTETSAATQYMVLVAGNWSSSSAINRVTFTPASATLVQNSTAYIYGIKNS